ncbi:MAG TPA: radical SAM family heme chaperone HemW [Candidatus Limnocylindria bacterium]|nr:radical SAM family heme chaperone HemW [Candidatus Limnocylindria bacterium]
MATTLPADSLSARPAPAGASFAARDPSPLGDAREQARLGLYVHVPFCAVRCAYCDFATGSLSAAKVARYFEGLTLEMARRADSARGVAFTSVFFGGGTPSALSSRHFERLWSLLRDHFTLAPDAEITLEANPESVRPALLDAWAAAGVNRLSMGAQSFDAQELERLGRIHDRDRPAEAVALARRHGFRRLSLDLMFGFPGHGLPTFDETLERTLGLDLEHVSAYCFIPEPDTPMGRSVLSGELALPSPEEQADLYQRLGARLGAEGYQPYEISNFSRPGGEARHNLVYWLRRDYLGIGPSAHGLWRGVRYGNHPALERWAACLAAGRAHDAVEAETPESCTEEIVMLGLRLSEGLRRRDYSAAVWNEVTHHYEGAFDAACATRRLVRTHDGWRIPAEHGFVGDDVTAWILAVAESRGFDSSRNRSVPSPPCPSQHSSAV